LSTGFFVIALLPRWRSVVVAAAIAWKAASFPGQFLSPLAVLGLRDLTASLRALASLHGQRQSERVRLVTDRRFAATEFARDPRGRCAARQTPQQLLMSGRPKNPLPPLLSFGHEISSLQ